jgi:hypothetical protein
MAARNAEVVVRSILRVCRWRGGVCRREAGGPVNEQKP